MTEGALQQSEVVRSFSVKRDRLLMVLACLTLFSLSVGTGPTSICSVLLLVVWLFSGVWWREKGWWWQQRHIVLPIVLVMLLPWISLVWTEAPNPKLNPFLQRSHFWLFSFVIMCIGLRDRLARYLVFSFVAGVQINVLLFLSKYIGFEFYYHKLYTFLDQGRITFSLLLACSIALISFVYKKYDLKRIKISLSILLIINFSVLCLQSGRSGYIAFIFLLPFIVFNLFNKIKYFYFVLILLVILSILSFSPTVQYRFNMIRTDLVEYNKAPDRVHDSQVGARFTFWKGAAKIFSENPLLGVGIDGYPVVMRRLYPELKSDITNPHNYYLYISASYGLFGVFAYGWLWLVAFRRAWAKRSDWYGFMLLSTLIVVSVGSLTESTPLLPQTGILLAMTIGLLRED